MLNTYATFGCTEYKRWNKFPHERVLVHRLHDKSISSFSYSSFCIVLLWSWRGKRFQMETLFSFQESSYFNILVLLCDFPNLCFHEVLLYTCLGLNMQSSYNRSIRWCYWYNNWLFVCHFSRYYPRNNTGLPYLRYRYVHFHRLVPSRILPRYWSHRYPIRPLRSLEIQTSPNERRWI